MPTIPSVRGGSGCSDPETFPRRDPRYWARGDEPRQSAWREFFECYAPPVYRVARLRGLSADDAEDIVQQVMLAVSQHIEGFRYDRDRGRFRQWVRRIAENKIVDLRRKPRMAGGAGLEEHSDQQATPDEI